MFAFVLKMLQQARLLEGQYLGIDASGMEANAAMKSIVRRDTGETYQEMLERLAEESGIETPSRAELIAFDRKRQGRKTANKDWQSTTDEEGAPSIDEPFALVADKGYHSRNVLKDLPDACTSRISEPAHKGRLRWHGDTAAREAVYGNKNRIRSGTGKALMRARGEKVERSFAHCLDRGGMRRVHLRGLANVEKRSIIHVAGFNLGVLLRALFGFGTPKGWGDAGAGLIFVQIDELNLFILVIWLPNAAEALDCAMIVFLRWSS